MTDDQEDVRAALHALAETAQLHRPSADALLRRHRHRTLRRRSAAAASVSALGVAAGVTIATAGDDPASRDTRSAHGHPDVRSTELDGQTIRLAGHTMRLPSGWTARGTAGCFDPDANPGDSGSALSGIATAASAAGGCLEAFLVGPAFVPPGLTPVRVGSAEGFDATKGSKVQLYIKQPFPSRTPYYLLLTATGISADELVTIAATGFAG